MLKIIEHQESYVIKHSSINMKKKNILGDSVKCFHVFFSKRSCYPVTGTISSSDIATNTIKLSTPSFSYKEFLMCTPLSKYGFLR